MVWDLSEVVLPKWTLTADYTEQIRVIDEVACQSKSPDPWYDKISKHFWD
jgi:hypothetical protein